jgi:hypothetical protein
MLNEFALALLLAVAAIASSLAVYASASSARAGDPPRGGCGDGSC